ncbi:transcriptional regulator, RpiR family [Roseovarius azorensis]|uniref:Transcriptional regulator, RpiR family n=1 Tax=Roseovarius azorensis TaxID=1287727 RepID=A0A1H7Q8X3_9RHOB|nr:MurR/RpiR family transcriptional regulator [Roseovarius azorensis]SEL44611.1 transcriptional regulator, RpiR family [Roseovarius azorensis]
MPGAFEQRLAENYEALSEKLRRAGEYVAAHPVDTATRSLRAVAQESGLAPATFSRMARALDYASFEELREVMRAKIGRRVNSFAERAERLQAAHATGEMAFFDAHLAACQGNLQTLSQEIDRDLLEQAVDRLHRARHVVLVGALGSTGIVEYFAYMANFVSANWAMAGRMGASVGSGLTDLDARDVVVVVTKPPFSMRAIRAAEAAQAQGAYVVVITDTHACPALRHAGAGFVVPTDSPHFYSSYVATMVLVETMVGMLVSRAGPEARTRIGRIEESNRRLQEVWDG